MVLSHEICSNLWQKQQETNIYHMPTFSLSIHKTCFRETETEPTTCHLDPLKFENNCQRQWFWLIKNNSEYLLLSMCHTMFYNLCVCVCVCVCMSSLNPHRNPNYLNLLCLTSPQCKMGTTKAPFSYSLSWWPASQHGPQWSLVILWFIIWNMYLVFVPFPGTERPKYLEFPKWLEQ